jgi:transposase
MDTLSMGPISARGMLVEWFDLVGEEGEETCGPALVREREGMQQDPFAAQALYVFIARRFDALKILSWDRNGFAVWWKRIESDEKFHWPSLLQEDVITLTAEQLNWLLDGYDVWSTPHRMIKFTHVS